MHAEDIESSEEQNGYLQDYKPSFQDVLVGKTLELGFYGGGAHLNFSADAFRMSIVSFADLLKLLDLTYRVRLRAIFFD
jgi:hypothetical protein